MKIRFLIHNGYAGGGTARTTLNTAAALAERGHDVEVVSMYRRRKKPAFEVAPGVRLHPLVDRWSAVKQPRRRSASLKTRLLWKLTRLLDGTHPVLYSRYDGRRKGVEILGDIRLARYIRAQRDGVLVGTRPGINVALALWSRPEPVVVAQDHMNMWAHSQFLKEQFRRCFGRLDAFVTLTETDAEASLKLLGARTRVLAIPNAVPPIGAAAGAATPEIDSKLVVAAGRLVPQKGFDRLLDVWALVAAEHPEWRLEIYGTGDPSEFRRHAEKLGIADSALFMGRTPRLGEIMSDAAMFVMSSRFEGFPMVLLEAMAIGLPVVSYDFPTGARELIDDGRNGYLVPNGDTQRFAARVCELIENPERRRQFGAAATEVADRYEPRRVATEWETLFTSLSADETRAGRRRAQPWLLRVQESQPASVLRLLASRGRSWRLPRHKPSP